MIQLIGTVRNGKIEVAAPSNLVDGTQVALLMINPDFPSMEQVDDQRSTA